MGYSAVQSRGSRPTFQRGVLIMEAVHTFETLVLYHSVFLNNGLRQVSIADVTMVTKVCSSL
jgi:hypothetical protein